MDIQSHDIIVSHRVLTIKKEQPPNIVCRLRDQRIKADCMSTYKNFLRENKETGLQAAQQMAQIKNLSECTPNSGK